MEDPNKTKKQASDKEQMGRYRLLEKLGQGGMGTVYKAQDTKLERIVALKTISNLRPDPLVIQRFEREAKVTARLRHAHIVALYDFEQIDGVFVLTMDFIDGCSLEQLLAHQRLPLQKACKMMLDILDAVAYAHEQNIVHRDLKPANILLDKQYRPFVTDFGLAKAMNDSAVVSQQGAVMGTPAYMSPEQAHGETADVCSDLFSLGVIFYEMLTGVRAFDGDNVFAILNCLVNGKFKPPREVDTAIPESVEQVCIHAMAGDRTLRYQSAREMALAIRQCFKTRPDKQEQTDSFDRTGIRARATAKAASEVGNIDKTIARPLNEIRNDAVAANPGTATAIQRSRSARRDTVTERKKLARRNHDLLLSGAIACLLTASLLVVLAVMSANKGDNGKPARTVEQPRPAPPGDKPVDKPVVPVGKPTPPVEQKAEEREQEACKALDYIRERGKSNKFEHAYALRKFAENPAFQGTAARQEAERQQQEYETLAQEIWERLSKELADIPEHDFAVRWKKITGLGGFPLEYMATGAGKNVNDYMAKFKLKLEERGHDCLRGLQEVKQRLLKEPGEETLAMLEKALAEAEFFSDPNNEDIFRWAGHEHPEWIKLWDSIRQISEKLREHRDKLEDERQETGPADIESTPEQPERLQNENLDDLRNDAMHAFDNVLQIIRDDELEKLSSHCTREFVQQMLQKKEALDKKNSKGMKLVLYLFAMGLDRIKKKPCLVNPKTGEAEIQIDENRPEHNLFMVRQDKRWKYDGSAIVRAVRKVSAVAQEKEHHRLAQEFWRNIVSAKDKMVAVNESCDPTYVQQWKRNQLSRILKRDKLQWQMYDTALPNIVVFITKHRGLQRYKVAIKVQNNECEIVEILVF